MFQVSAELLDACMLALLASGDAYGYKLTQDIKDVVNVSESTLYPVLRRLEREHFLEVYDSPHAGRNRRYYKITQHGRSKLKSYRLQWSEFSYNVGKLLLELEGEQK